MSCSTNKFGAILTLYKNLIIYTKEKHPQLEVKNHKLDMRGGMTTGTLGPQRHASRWYLYLSKININYTARQHGRDGQPNPRMHSLSEDNHTKQI